MGDYEVGYKKPPEHGKIKPGECRNPFGRRGKNPPASPPDNSLKEILERLENELVEFQGRMITKLEARMRVLQAMALKGDIRANQAYEGLCQRVGVGKPQQAAAGGVLLLPAPLPLEDWEASAAIQQAQFREPLDPHDLWPDGAPPARHPSD